MKRFLLLVFFAPWIMGASVGDRNLDYRTPATVVDSSDAEVKPGDAVNNAVRVNCVTGCSGSPGSSDGTILDGVSSSIKVTVFDRTNSNPLATQLVDSNGDPVAVGGGTQYNQGTAAADTDSLTMAGCVRADTAAVATGVADGDRARCIVDSTGRMWVHVGTIDGGTITSITNPVAVTQSGSWTNIGVTGPLTDTQLRATPVPVSGTVTVTDGSGALNVIVDSSALPTGAATAANQDGIIRDGTGDTTQANVTSGRLHVDGSGVTQPVSGTVTANAGTGTMAVSMATQTPSGSVAHDGVGTGVNPLLTGCYSSAAAPTDVSADGDATREWCLRNGARAVQPTFAGVLQSTGNGTAGTGTPRVTIASDNTAFAVNSNPGTAANWGVYVEDAGETAGGNLSMVGAVRRDTLASSSGTSGDNSTVNTTADGAIWVAPVAATNGGTSTSRLVSAATTNATNLKASAGQVYAIIASNVNASARYIHLYNTSGTPTCNASIINTFIIPGNTAGAGTNISIPPGVAFGTGIGYCITTSVDGTGSVAANEIVANFFFR